MKTLRRTIIAVALVAVSVPGVAEDYGDNLPKEKKNNSPKFVDGPCLQLPYYLDKEDKEDKDDKDGDDIVILLASLCNPEAILVAIK